MTAKHRNGPRKVELDGGVYLRPTVAFCDSFTHPLANREFLFPYVSVVEVPQAEVLKQIGPSLVVTAVTKDPAFTSQLLESPLIRAAEPGADFHDEEFPWDQPHEEQHV